MMGKPVDNPRLSKTGASAYLEYEHHGRQVKVRTDLKDRHREYCLCYACAKFEPKLSTNCPIAQATYEHCVRSGITTPVWECPEFVAVEKSVEDRGLLTDDAAIDRYFAFLAGGLCGVFMCFAIPAVMAVIIETFGLSVR